MRDEHGHTHALHPVAERPTVSLLRLSAWQRLAAAGVVLGGLWLAVIAAIGWI